MGAAVGVEGRGDAIDASDHVADANLRAESELFELNAAIASEQLRDLRENREARNEAAANKARADKFRIWLNAGVLCLAAAMILGLAAMVFSAARSRAVIIEAFDAPEALAPYGLTGKAAATRVQDGLARIQRNVRSSVSKRDVANGWTQAIEIEVPKTGLSIGQIDRLLKSWLGNDTHVGGTILQLAGDRIELTVRGDNILAKSFEGSRAEFPALAARAAEYVYGESEPALMGLYLVQQGRYQDTDTFIGSKIGRADTADKVQMLGNWGSALDAIGRHGEAIDKFRAALQIDPTAFSRWDGLVQMLQNNIGYEAARREAERMMAAYEAMPADQRPPAIKVQNGLLLFNDWQRLSAANLEDEARAAGGTTLSDNRQYLVENALMLHDYAQVQMRQAQLALPPREMRSAILALEGARRSDLGDLPGALAHFRRASQLAVGTSKEKARITSVAVTLARLGQTAEARSLIQPLLTDTSYYAQSERLRALAGRDNIIATKAAYGKLIASAPSMPDAYESWGRTKLVERDFAGAERLFLRAARQAPRWGDAWEGCGVARAAQGDWAGATVCYRHAVEFAPAWPSLRARLQAAISNTIPTT